MRVLKFGGTSVRNSHWIDKTLDIAEEQLSHALILVSSAMGKTTNKLQEIACTAEKGNHADSEKMIEELKASHVGAAKELLQGPISGNCVDSLCSLFSELGSVVKGLALLRERTRRSNDLILSFGERLATILIVSRARQRGMDATLLDARNFIKTDENFAEASPLGELTFGSSWRRRQGSPDVSWTQGVTVSLASGCRLNSISKERFTIPFIVPFPGKTGDSVSLASRLVHVL